MWLYLNRLYVGHCWLCTGTNFSRMQMLSVCKPSWPKLPLCFKNKSPHFEKRPVSAVHQDFVAVLSLHFCKLSIPVPAHIYSSPIQQIFIIKRRKKGNVHVNNLLVSHYFHLKFGIILKLIFKEHINIDVYKNVHHFYRNVLKNAFISLNKIYQMQDDTIDKMCLWCKRLMLFQCTI